MSHLESQSRRIYVRGVRNLTKTRELNSAHQPCNILLLRPGLPRRCRKITLEKKSLLILCSNVFCVSSFSCRQTQVTQPPTATSAR